MKKCISVVMLLFCWIGFVSAGEPLTWEDCVKFTLKNNNDIKSSQESVRSSKAQYKSSYSGFMPDVSADAGFRESGSMDSSSSDDSYSMGLSARQSIFSGFKNKASVDRQKAELDSAVWNHELVKSQISYDLKSAFAQLLYAQEFLDVTRTISDRLKENTRLVELKYEMGVENKGAYLKSRADYTQALYEVSQAERSLAAKKKKLADIIGEKDYKNITLTGNFAVKDIQENPDFSRLAKETPSYNRARAQVQIRRASKTSVIGELYPGVSASGSLSSQGESWPPDDDRWSVGASVSLPIFSGGRNIMSVKSADAQYKAALLDFESANLEISAEIENAYNALADAGENVAVKEAYLDAARVRSEIAQSRYTKGLISFEDWDKIENELINSEKAKLGSMRDALIAEASWEKSIGKGVLQ